jgi:signal peptidase I
MFNAKICLKAFILTAIFMLGFVTSNIYANLNTENPTNLNITGDNRTDEVASPSKWITEDKIGVYSQKVILDVEDPQWAMFTDTHSMEPVISSRSYAIEVVPKSADEINVGDILSYNSDYADGTIIHRVIEKGTDSDGTYFILKGDNNPSADPGRIRFSQVQRVVVAIIY